MTGASTPVTPSGRSVLAATAAVAAGVRGRGELGRAAGRREVAEGGELAALLGRHHQRRHVALLLRDHARLARQRAQGLRAA